DSALEPLLRIALVPGVGPARLAALLRRFGSPERVLGASAQEVGRIPGFGGETVRRLGAAAEPAATGPVGACMARLRKMGAVGITPDDASYPDDFRGIADAPYLLFAAGRLELLGNPAIGIVGTREPTPYGRSTAATLAGELAGAGFAVVSGMAKGIDAAAHEAALDARGGTVGVLGQGIDGVYPAENRRLFERVRGEGCLLSEYPPGEEPRAGNFPRRNRLIAALSAGVLVVEMAARSGAQHTVNYALEQGKEIFAVPGPIGSATSAGTNQMLKDGARLVTGVQDILEELGGVGTLSASPRAPRPEIPAPTEPAEPEGLSAEERRVFAALGPDPLHVDPLGSAAGLPPGQLLPALLALELRGVVEALPGKHFRRS
ncbi:MAG: DNA-processing protein DprA, partial [Gemmatimonadota bacterium]|nr:DNA-processing protein DprA [Gemmatimonadota bacterium]